MTAHRGMGLTEAYWRAILEAIDGCHENFSVPQDIREEVTVFPAQFEPAVIGSLSYRDVVFVYPGMDITKGMRSAGTRWPKTDKPSWPRMDTRATGGYPSQPDDWPARSCSDDILGLCRRQVALVNTIRKELHGY